MTATHAESIVRARIDTKTKQQSEAMLAAMGLSMSEAIRLFLVQTVRARGLPFAVLAPNAETRRAIADSRAGKVRHHASAEALFADLDSRD